MNRRGFLTGVAGFLAAPAIVRAASLMPVSVWKPESFRCVGPEAFVRLLDGTEIGLPMVLARSGDYPGWIPVNIAGGFLQHWLVPGLPDDGRIVRVRFPGLARIKN